MLKDRKPLDAGPWHKIEVCPHCRSSNTEWLNIRNKKRLGCLQCNKWISEVEDRRHKVLEERVTELEDTFKEAYNDLSLRIDDIDSRLDDLE